MLPGSLSPEADGVRCSLGPESLSIFSRPWFGCFGATQLDSVIILPINKTLFAKSGTRPDWPGG